MRMNFSASWALITCLGVLPAMILADEPPPIDFDRDIRPVLSDRCYPCHGPDSESHQADLRLDIESESEQSVVVAGDAKASELYRRITASDRAERMPPVDSKLILDPGEIERIRNWIEQGARWSTHWAFTPPKVAPVPKVANKSWPRNPIDYFILSRLERAGRRPAARADRAILIRRLSFDLTGLPPTLDEIDSFVNDTSAGAYEKVVDRLLASRHYGERMAASWLDVARYSDTYGYQVDRDRYVWPWRDWVIRAFNDNLPYDEFIVDQLAGDLLPNATDDQILATTFNRLHPQKVEGGSVPEEFRLEYVADRTQTFATAFLGLTMGCCRCHDHKFDPITQKEYYALSAFFDNIDEAGLYSYFTESVPTPTLLLADDKTKKECADLDHQIARAEDALTQLATTRRAAMRQWLRQVRDPDSPVAKGVPRSAAPFALPGCIAHLEFDDVKSTANRSVAGKFGNAVQLTGDDGIELKVGNFHRYEPFSISLWMNTPDSKERAVVFHRSRAWTDAGSRGYQLLLEDGCLSASLIHFWPGNALRVRTRAPVPINQWLHVCVTYDGSSRARGLRIYLDGKRAECNIVRDHLYKNITGGGGDHITIGQRFRDRGFTNGLVDEFRVFDRELTTAEVSQLHDGHSLTDLIDSVDPATDPAGMDLLYRYYLATADDAYSGMLTRLRARRKRRCETGDSIPEIMVMRELPRPRPTYVRRRGAYDAAGALVHPDTPSACPPFPKGQPRNRLGLARWLLGPDHPLTARVAVNRLWQLCFGNGLVRTPEDFGSQGEPPTHPELLDWLARDFVHGRWNVKRMLKQFVMSATYQQASTGAVAAFARDPDNRLLGRGPRYRLTAEMLRDNALAASGLLVDRIGGPPARPYEVEASFKPAKRDTGDGLYRRSLYTYWRRTAPAPVMMVFDASKRDVCRVRRERTSTPLQAMVLLNGPQFVESARVLAQRVIRRHDGQMERAMTDMFRILTSRRPTNAETGILMALYERQLRYFKRDPERARQYLRTGAAPADPNSIRAGWPRPASSPICCSITINRR